MTMHADPHHRAGHTQPERHLSIAEAKLRLLDWAEAEDAALHQKWAAAVTEIRAVSRKALPWAGGAAAVAGLLWAIRGRKGDSPGKKGPFRVGIGVAATAVKLGLKFGPLLGTLLSNRPREQETDPGPT